MKRSGEVLVVLFFISMCIACGSESTSDSASSGGGGGSSGGGSGGTSGDSIPSFQFVGTLASLSVTSSLSKQASSGNVTDVLAVSPESANAGCKTASVGSDRAFTLNVNGKKPWFLMFLDRSRRGREMFLGRFRTSTLDVLFPRATSGTVQLGTVTIGSGEATASSSHSDILGYLGLDAESAATLGDNDDLSRRYSNPDVDGDGQLDCAQSDHTFMLDFHVRYNMLVGGSSNATIADIIDAFLSDATTIQYTGTGVYIAYPSIFAAADTGSVTFENAVTTSEGGAIAANTATAAVTTNNFSNFFGFGPNTTSASELPSGTIVFNVASKTLTFTDVRTPTNAQLTSSTGRIFPFMRFNKTDSSCTSNCTLSGVSYKWMKKTATSWTAATTAEIDLVVSDSNTGYISFRVGNNSSKTIGITIPKTSADGTISWDPANASLSGVSAAEFTNLVTSNICHLGLSYDDRLGMRIFQNINNAAGTCS